MPLSAFDGVVYINLDHREDRKLTFLKEMERLNVKKLYRLPAHYDPLNGLKGCLISHIKALDFMEKKGWKRGLNLEDDCFFIKDLTVLKTQIWDFFQLVDEDWDAFLLGGLYWDKKPTSWESVVRIRYAKRSHAYCIKHEYITVIKEHFQRAYEQIKKDIFFINSRLYAVDVVWEELQSKDRWYAPAKQLAFQSESFSDIEYCEREERRE